MIVPAIMPTVERESTLFYGPAMDLILTIPDDLAARLGAKDLPRQALEALAAEAYRTGRLTQPEMRRLLGMRTHARLDSFLKAHGIDALSTGAQPDHDADEANRADALVARFRSFRAGKMLGGLNPSALIREGRR